ncbi:G-type lectin S-receptor-like serine/threonine-protein kinase At2g19130 [Elaeis guineensis]|uniref:G-type lectin S-receptor-like serine/threonine-protein kinase At2g19130 n=1 Tax=Elaeis guineensis var. tenera TaxID=51953 RepID=UPI003C6D7A64
MTNMRLPANPQNLTVGSAKNSEQACLNNCLNFSEILGSGGFGSVFKGTLVDSTDVAVKKLEGLRQGEKQFQTEVSPLAAIQHVHLVRLRGFCSEGSKRLLLYENMSGGSLDCHLFQNNSTVLGWKMRYQFILGILRGLAYLQEKCRECNRHCDK